MSEEPRIDIRAVGDLLDGTWKDVRRQTREVLAGQEFHPPLDGTVADKRAWTLGRLHALVEHGTAARAFPAEFGGHDDNGGNLAGFEELVAADPSLQIKGGVQWGLFGGAILHLGTAEHHRRWLPGAISLEIPGAFAMTETGHGSDVASLATVAKYDPQTEEFEITTPFRAAWKDYLGNAAQDARAAVVFAQLETLGVRHGVHAFFVPIRDDNGAFLPGIGGEDDGPKGGLNGVDNGRLHFDHVRVPRTNLLNRYGDVAPDGTYSSPIASPGRRFFTILGTLVQGRVSLDGAAVTAAKLGLDIAIRYGLQRRQFSGSDEHRETVLLDYQRHQRRLFPLLAKTYAAQFAHEQLLTEFDRVFSGTDDSDEARQLLETEAAGFKALSTWQALDTLQECREACGGQGFLAENRITGLRADLDVYATFEGDNTVLLQLVAKRLLADYSKEFRNIDAGGVARFIATQAAEFTLHRSGLRNLGESVADAIPTAPIGLRLRAVEAQTELIASRAQTMVAELARNLRPAAKLPRAEAAALFDRNQHELIETARAHVELRQWRLFCDAVERVQDPGTRKVLARLRDLFGLTLIEEHIGWHLMYGRLSMKRAREVGPTIERLLVKLRPHALDLVEAFGYGPGHRRAPIATDAERVRQREAWEWQRRRRASRDQPREEKHLRR